VVDLVVLACVLRATTKKGQLFVLPPPQIFSPGYCRQVNGINRLLFVLMTVNECNSVSYQLYELLYDWRKVPELYNVTELYGFQNELLHYHRNYIIFV